MVKKLAKFCFCGLLLLSNKITSQNNIFYKHGEQINFSIYYSVIGIYFKAGSCKFELFHEDFEGQPVYHVIATGWSNAKYDWIFKVRDKYESYIAVNDFKPLYFKRNVNEGKYKINEYIDFNYQSLKAKSNKGEFPIPNAVQDVLSAIYYTRFLDYNKYKIGDKIYFNMFLDNELFQAYIKYDGKEVITTKLGTFHTIRVKPLLIKGTVFKGGEGMTVWITDDANHMPLKVSSPVSVGSVKCEIESFSNILFPLESKVSKPK
ncbi:MAG: DUF3108 domain-containing protein [Alphaproteobacteria bacterium]|nr:DUF3108 domain-containing protein [Alphaproteobacteria bacterium]